jgi:hypothetical protein
VVDFEVEEVVIDYGIHNYIIDTLPPFQYTLLTESHQTKIKREGKASGNLAITLNSQ